MVAPNQNIALKVALLEKGMSQRELAMQARIAETRISQIIRGWERPTFEMKESICNVLDKEIEELFKPQRAYAA